jgi:dTDP-4-dehydrorhamnose 3,5-epimerase-like enzyme
MSGNKLVNEIRTKSFSDDRGKLVAFNDFSLEGIKRMYQIEHPDIGMVRAWQGHKIENKWFYVIKGSFAIGYARIDNFNNPSSDTSANFKVIKAKDKVIFHIPKGYANGLKSLESDSRIIVFSDLTLEEAKNDNFKYDADLWLNWDDLI